MEETIRENELIQKYTVERMPKTACIILGRPDMDKALKIYELFATKYNVKKFSTEEALRDLYMKVHEVCDSNENHSASAFVPSEIDILMERLGAHDGELNDDQVMDIIMEMKAKGCGSYPPVPTSSDESNFGKIFDEQYPDISLLDVVRDGKDLVFILPSLNAINRVASELLKNNAYFKDEYSDLFAKCLGGESKWNFMAPGNHPKIQYTESSKVSNGLSTGYILPDELITKIKEHMIAGGFSVDEMNFDDSFTEIVKNAYSIINREKRQ